MALWHGGEVGALLKLRLDEAAVKYKRGESLSSIVKILDNSIGFAEELAKSLKAARSKIERQQIAERRAKESVK